jgi:hypothetical protein
MASGSQVCRGTCADFAKAPTSSPMQPGDEVRVVARERLLHRAERVEEVQRPVPRKMK